MMGRALGYPSYGKGKTCDVAYTRTGFKHMERVNKEHMVYDYGIEVHPNSKGGLEELVLAVAHFLVCRETCLEYGLVDFQFALGGRTVATQLLEKLMTRRVVEGPAGREGRLRPTLDFDAQMLTLWDAVNDLKAYECECCE